MQTSTLSAVTTFPYRFQREPFCSLAREKGICFQKKKQGKTVLFVVEILDYVMRQKIMEVICEIAQRDPDEGMVWMFLHEIPPSEIQIGFDPDGWGEVYFCYPDNVTLTGPIAQ